MKQPPTTISNGGSSLEPKPPSSDIGRVNESQLHSHLITKRQLAHRYGVSERTIHTLMKSRVIPSIRVRRLVRFDPVACDAALRKNETKAI